MKNFNSFLSYILNHKSLFKGVNKIINVEQAVKISQELRAQGKKIVLAGGIFDILHIGHIRFLEKAKKLGDYLFVLLESDKKARETKGENRPINTQKNRALVLSGLAIVDYVVILPSMKKNRDYDRLVSQIKPSFIATTNNDPYKKHKERQARQIGSKVVYVIKRVASQSTSKLAKLIERKSL